MTINVNTSRNEYTATSGQTVFNFTFKIYTATDLNVYVTPAGQECNDVTDLTEAYTVTGVGLEDGGSITLNTGAGANDLVTIVSAIPTSRITDYQSNGDFTPETVNNDIDRAISLIKQVESKANRSLLSSESLQGPKPLTLPKPASGEFVRWKSDLSGLENVPGSAIAEEVIVETDYAIAAAAASAAAALVSEGNALTYRDAAQTAQTAAEAAQTAAETAYDNFDDRYLGSFTTAAEPTLDNDGDALLDGALYWNTTVPELRVYDLTGTSWVSTQTYTPTKAGIDALNINADTLDNLDSTAFGRLATAADWTATQSYNRVTLTDAATITWDMATSPSAAVSLSANRTMGNPTNEKAGNWYSLRIYHSGAPRTLAWGSYWKFGGNGAPELSTVANAYDVLTFYAATPTVLTFVGITKNIMAV